MKYICRISLIVMSVLVVHSFGGVATAQDDCTYGIDWVAAPNAAEAVFVTDPVCGAIVRVGNVSAEAVFYDPDFSYEGLIYGPDEMLYALDAILGLIDIFDPTTSYAEEPFGSVYARTDDSGLSPWFGRFNQRGDLLVTDRFYPRVFAFKNTVLIEDGIDLDGTPHLVWDFHSEDQLAGVTFDANGDLQVVNRSADEVLRFPYNPACPDYDLGDGDPCLVYDYPGPPINLNPESGALGVSRASNRDVFVATETGLQRFDKDGGAEDVCWPFDDEAMGLSVDQSANDTQYFTVLAPVEDIGVYYPSDCEECFPLPLEVQLWEVPFGYDPCADDFGFFCGDDARLLATFSMPMEPGDIAPPVLVFDVALPFTDREAADFDCDGFGDHPAQGIKPIDLDGGGQGFNSFDAYIEFIPSDSAPTCRVKVRSQEHSPMEINAVIEGGSNALMPSRPLVLPGDNGRMRVWFFDELNEEGVNCPEGDPDGPPLYTRNFSAFFTLYNPKLALCHDTGDPQCNLQQINILDLVYGDIPDDGKLGGFDPRFSQGFLVDQVILGPDGYPVYDGEFCGFLPPVYKGKMRAEKFKAGSAVPIKIKPVLDGTPCGGKTIPDLVAVLAVSRIEGDTAISIPFEDLTFNGKGSAEDYRAVFYPPKSRNSHYQLIWKTVDRYGDRLPKGLYKLTVIDDSAATNGGDEIYFGPQSIMIELK